MTEKGEGTEREKEVCQEKRGCPARGKRYSPAQKQEILEYAVAHDVQAAAEKFQLTGASIYEWRRCLKRRGVTEASDKEGGKIVADYLLDIILNRYSKRKSTVITSNRPIEDWGRLLKDNAASSAI
ncbi:MAG: ATP-binding protein, partial [Thermodesulfobacteriota bacterium]|nr:ATP-binding protein [Thermodesulfobacteriota bacterium]